MQASVTVAPTPPPVPLAGEGFHVYAVAPGCVELMWPVVEPLLARAVARERGRFTTRDVYFWLIHGQQQLWVVTQRGRCWAAGLVRLNRHPTGKRAATLHLLGGSHVRSWAMDAWAAWRESCRLSGITEMNIVGRKGWTRIVRPFGFEPEAVVLTREEV